jgi:hypothetical protein
MKILIILLTLASLTSCSTLQNPERFIASSNQEVDEPSNSKKYEEAEQALKNLVAIRRNADFGQEAKSKAQHCYHLGQILQLAYFTKLDSFEKCFGSDADVVIGYLQSSTGALNQDIQNFCGSDGKRSSYTKELLQSILQRAQTTLNRINKNNCK